MTVLEYYRSKNKEWWRLHEGDCPIRFRDRNLHQWIRFNKEISCMYIFCIFEFQKKVSPDNVNGSGWGVDVSTCRDLVVQLWNLEPPTKQMKIWKKKVFQATSYPINRSKTRYQEAISSKTWKSGGCLIFDDVNIVSLEIDDWEIFAVQIKCWWEQIFKTKRKLKILFLRFGTVKHAFQRLHFPDLNGDSSNEALHLAYETKSRPPRTSFAYSASNAAFVDILDLVVHCCASSCTSNWEREEKLNFNLRPAWVQSDHLHFRLLDDDDECRRARSPRVALGAESVSSSS